MPETPDGMVIVANGYMMFGSSFPFPTMRAPIHRRLTGGRLSEIAAYAQDDGWLRDRFEESDNQWAQARALIFALCLRAAEHVVYALEDKDYRLRQPATAVREPDEVNYLFNWYRQTARDVLLYEAFLFFRLALDQVAKPQIDVAYRASFDIYAEAAAALVGSLAREIFPDFDDVAHCQLRRSALVAASPGPDTMKDVLRQTLARSTGKKSLAEADRDIAFDVNLHMYLKILLKQEVDAPLQAASDMIAAYYREKFDPALWQPAGR